MKIKKPNCWKSQQNSHNILYKHFLVYTINYSYSIVFRMCNAALSGNKNDSWSKHVNSMIHSLRARLTFRVDCAGVEQLWGCCVKTSQLLTQEVGQEHDTRIPIKINPDAQHILQGFFYLLIQ